MPHLCPNLHFLYLEFPLIERFRRAADDGFTAVEMTYPYETDIEDLRHAADRAGVSIVEFNAPVGELIHGVRRGVAAVPGHEAEFYRFMLEGLRYATGLGCRNLLTLAGVVPPGESREPYFNTFVSNLRVAADMCAEHGTTLLIESNNVRDFPNYFLRTIDEARQVIKAVERPNLGLVFDFYHVQINEGDVLTRFHDARDIIAHIQFANAPKRTEPGVGELDFNYILSEIDRDGFSGYCGAECYASTGVTQDTIGWFVKNGWLESKEN